MLHRGFRRHVQAAPGRYVLAVLIVGLAAYLELLIATSGESRFLFVVLLAAVAACAWLGGVGPGLVAVVAALAAADYFIVGPGALFTVNTAVDAFALGGFAAGGLLLCGLLHFGRESVRAERQARATAQRASEHAERTAQLANAFARVRSSDEALELALQEPWQALRGDATMLALVQDGAATIARAAGYEDLRQDAAVGPFLPPQVLRETLRSRTPVVIASSEQWLEYGCSPEDAPQCAALILVPLLVHQEVAAIIRVDYLQPHGFTALDHAFLALFADHAGRALERTWDHEADQRARVEAETLRARADEELGRRQIIEQALRASETRYRALATRTTRLHALTAALSEAVTTHAVASAIVQQGTVVVGATAGDVLMLGEDGTQLQLLVPGVGAVVAIDAEPGLCEMEALSTRAPVFVASWVDAQERYWRSATRAADEGYASSAVLPLVVDGAPVGVLRFEFSVPVNFDEEYQALLVSVAQHCTQALDRARLYESAQRAQRDAEAASRLKDEFLSIVSHELRTPLNAVLGWSAMLEKTGVDPNLAHRAVRSIQENAARQAKLIDDLLDVSRIAAGHATLDLQDIQSGDIVSAVVESLIPVAASAGVELRLSCIDSAVLQGDRRRLEQVFFNVIGNALKFTASGGSVDVVARVTDGAADVLVTDTGIGIDGNFLPHVFDRFRQADATSTRAYGGLGLGLAISKQLVEAHGGEISVSSLGTGHGTSFRVRLPLAAGEPRRQLQEPTSAPPRRAVAEWPRLDGVRVLAVDDEPAVREIMACTLGDCGAVVTTAASAPEAFDLLSAGDFDVLLADVAMPGEDGCSLIRRIRSCPEPRLAVLPAAAVTAHARDEERRDVLEAGFHLHLVKPIEPRDLACAVKELVAGRHLPVAAGAPQSLQ
jgi:K+-sensing histidine kinase KdpD